MTPRDLTADLPAPRDDEPASLRDDIADELRDHLECALRREELKSRSEPWGSAPRTDAGNTSNAYQRVLAKFGNPRAVARKLWFDAMRERIMGQRFVAVMSAITAIACVLACAFIWQWTNAETATRAKAAATQQEVLALLQQQLTLKAIVEPTQQPPSEWGTVSVRLVSADDTSAPVKGAATLIKRVVDRDSAEITRWEPVTSRITADHSGAIDLGKVPVGEYSLKLECDVTRLMSVSWITVEAAGYHELVHCPVHLPENAEVTFDFKFPPIFKDTLFTVEVQPEPLKINGRHWSSETSETLLVRGDSSLLGHVTDVRRLGGQDEAMENFFIAEDENQMVPFADAIEYSSGPVELPVGKYRGCNLRAYLPGRIQNSPGSRLIGNESGWEVIAHLKFEVGAGQTNAWPLPVWDSFLDPIARRLVRFGLRPIPEGLAVVKYHAPQTFRPLNSYPEGQTPQFKSTDGRPLNKPGCRVDVFVADGHPLEPSTPRTLLLENVEYFFTEPSDSKQWAEGGDIDWIISLLVAPEAVPIVERAAKHNTLELAPHSGNAVSGWGRIVNGDLIH